MNYNLENLEKNYIEIKVEYFSNFKIEFVIK